MIGFFGFCASSFLASLGYIRTIQPWRTIGTDPAATILFSLSSISFWTFIPLVTSKFVKLLAGGLQARNGVEKKRVAAFSTAFRTALPWLWLLSMIASLSPMFILINPANSNLMFGAAACHFVVLSLVMIITSTVCFIVIPPILRDIRSVLDQLPDPRLKSIEYKINRFKMEVRNQAAVQSATAAIFGLWPYVQRYSSYEVAIA